MSRKTTSQTTAKKNTTVPPKAAEATKAVTFALPASTVAATAEKSTAASTKVESKSVVTAKADATPAAATKVETTPAAATVKATTQDRSATAATTIAALHSEDADLARDAATALGILGDRSAVEPLVQVLNNVDGYFHSVVRAAAAESLGALGDARAVESLLSALTDPIAEVSSESIRALATLGDAQALDALIDVVQNRYGFFLPIARRAAVFGLAKLGGDRALEQLRAVAGDTFEDATIRDAAETGISQHSTASTK